MYSYIKWERSYVSGVKGCKIKINLEMPNDVFSDSPPVRPHAWYYIYGEPHTYTCWPLCLQKPRMRLIPAPCLGGRGCWWERGDATIFILPSWLLWAQGVWLLFALHLFLWEFLHFHLSGNQMERENKQGESLFCSETHKNLRLNLQQVAEWMIDTKGRECKPLKSPFTMELFLSYSLVVSQTRLNFPSN